MFINTKKLEEKLNNHLKLLSMISDKILPIKQSLIEDIKDMKNILEVSHKQKRENNK